MSKETKEKMSPEMASKMRGLMETMVNVLPIDFLIERLEEAISDYKENKSEEALKHLKAAIIATAIRLENIQELTNKKED